MTDDFERTTPAAGGGGMEENTGFEIHLRSMMASVSEALRQPPGLASQVIERGRRQRRRRAVAAAVALAVAVVGVVVVPQVLPEKKSVMPPADTSVLSPPLDSVYGVDVHWLPDGFGVQSRDLYERGVDRFAVDTRYSRLPVTQTFASHRSSFSPDSPIYGVQVTRGVGSDIEAWARRADEERSHAGLPPATRTSAVQGHPTYTLTAEGEFSLFWSPEPMVLLSVHGPSPTDARKIAESLVVGPTPSGPDGPGQSQQAESALRNAFPASPGTDPRLTLRRVQDGSSLIPAMDEALRTGREAMESIRVDERWTGPAVFLSETEAMIELALAVRLRESDVRLGNAVRMVLTADGWKVRKEDYCTAMAGLSGLFICPPITIS